MISSTHQKWLIRVTKDNINLINSYRKDRGLKDINVGDIQLSRHPYELDKTEYWATNSTKEIHTIHSLNGYAQLTDLDFVRLFFPNLQMIGADMSSLPKDIKGRVKSWGEDAKDRELQSIIGSYDMEFKSYGITNFDEKVYVMFEEEDYSGVNYYMVLANDIINLYVTKIDKQAQPKEITNEKLSVGYKLVKEEYRQAALRIIYSDDERINSDGELSITSGDAISKLRDAGVLDLWFEPFYNQIIISMNDMFNLRIKNKRVYHGYDDITDYVMGIGAWWETASKLRFNGYDFKIMSLTLCKTGCENKMTKIENWLKIYNLIK
jgi:hypothetical protein